MWSAAADCGLCPQSAAADRVLCGRTSRYFDVRRNVSHAHDRYLLAFERCAMLANGMPIGLVNGQHSTYVQVVGL